MINNFAGGKHVIQERGHVRTETRLCLVEHDVGLLGDVELDWPKCYLFGHGCLNSS